MRVPVFLLCMMVLLAVGCGGAPEGAPTTSNYEQARAAAAKKHAKGNKRVVKRKPAKAQGNVDPEGNSFGSSETGFVYDPVGKRDPFHSFVLDAITEDEVDGDRGPLELFDLSQLQLAAVIVSASNPHGLVYDPSGKGYIVGVGASMGKKNGRVVEIDDGTMVVRETYVDFSGTKTARNVELKIRHKGGEL